MEPGWDGYGSTASRVYLKNLSFGIAKATIAKYFTDEGFQGITEGSVHVVRTGSYGSGRLCTAFVTMLSWDDVDLAVSKMHGSLIPRFSHKKCHAERAIPRLQTMTPHATRSDHVDKRYQDKSGCESAETKDADLSPNSVAAQSVVKWTTVKKEEADEHHYSSPMAEATRFQEAMQQPWKRRRAKRGEL